MMPFALLLRYWKYGAALLVLIAIAIYHFHYGHVRYEAGEAAEKARWQPVLAAAQQELAAANARTQALESAAQAISNEAEQRHAQTIADLNQRAADADVRFRALGVRLRAAAAACRQQLPEVAAGESGDAGAAESERRASEAGASIGATGRDCADDAARVEFWTGWYREQAALRDSPPAHR